MTPARDPDHSTHAGPHAHPHEHPHEHDRHALAAIFAHTHDSHAPEGSAESDHGGERVSHDEMVGAPGRHCEFDADRTRLALLYQAMCGHHAELAAYDERTDARVPDSVHTLYLPGHAPIDEHHGLTRSEWYRVAVTHRAMHLLLGTFDLDLERAEPLFARRRPAARSGDPRAALQQFIATFADTALAVEIFVTLEDLRIDAAAARLLPGLATSYRLACHEALHERPPLAMLPARDAVAEALVQFSLGAAGVYAPAALDTTLAQIVAASRPLLDPRASVESSAEAAIRVYDAICAVPARARYRSARAVTFDELLVTAPPESAAADSGGESEVIFYPVPFRDATGARHATGDPESGLLLEQAILRPESSQQSVDDADADEQTDDGDSRAQPGPGTAGDRGAQTLHDQSPSVPAARGLAVPDDDGLEHASSGSRLYADGPGEFVYPEWDGVAGRYLDRWCLVRVTRAPAANSLRRHREAMVRHRHLLPHLISALERMQPAGRDIVRRRPHGDDIDLDACIEAVCDLRAGVEPSDLVFASTQMRRRDVAVGFAIDLSASTAEALPPDPREPGRVRSTLDVQRDAVALVTEALDRVGDTYGVYGFSGSGRDDVRLSLVKDFDERRSPRTIYRLEGLVPDHTTRMGPAIRHVAARLSLVDAATKILLVISDGRPYDIDYGQRYGEAATIGYALEDTGKALAEARRGGVRPYLVTVDAAGADYLSEICDPREYHVIDDARELPRSLAELYVVARSDAFGRRGLERAAPATLR